MCLGLLFVIIIILTNVYNMEGTPEMKQYGGAACGSSDTVPDASQLRNPFFDNTPTTMGYVKRRLLSMGLSDTIIREECNLFFYGEGGTITSPSWDTAEYYTGRFRHLPPNEHNERVVEAISAKIIERVDRGRHGSRSRSRHGSRSRSRERGSGIGGRSRSKLSKKGKKHSIHRKRSLKNKTRKH